MSRELTAAASSGEKRYLVALPVYNEAAHVDAVLDCVARHSEHVLVVDDGSTDATPERLAGRNDVAVLRHAENRGYGAALQSAFDYAEQHGFDVLVTIDCDGQHQPQRIPDFVAACRAAGDDGRRPDIVSGSRYLQTFEGDSAPPVERRRINMQITEEINARLGLNLTDAFCGFKAYRVAALNRIRTTETGYAMPLELWVRAAAAGLRIVELPVPLVYLDETRSFGGELDDGAARLAYYHRLLDRTIQEVALAVESGGESECPSAPADDAGGSPRGAPCGGRAQ